MFGKNSKKLPSVGSPVESIKELKEVESPKLIPSEPKVVPKIEPREEEYENPDDSQSKKKEIDIEEAEEEDSPEELELTEEVVKKVLDNLSYRIGRIEHLLRLDY